jgi:hypothetical protein
VEIAYKFYCHNLDYQFKAHIICGLYGTYGLGQNLYTDGVLVAKPKGRDRYEDLGIDEKIILKE